jgi:hypothetical protein
VEILKSNVIQQLIAQRLKMEILKVIQQLIAQRLKMEFLKVIQQLIAQGLKMEFLKSNVIQQLIGSKTTFGKFLKIRRRKKNIKNDFKLKQKNNV